MAEQQVENKSLDVAAYLGKKYLNVERDTVRQLFFVMLFLALFFGLITLFFHNSTRKVQVLLADTTPLFNKKDVHISSTKLNSNNTLKETYILYLNFENSSSSHAWFHDFISNKPILTRGTEENFMVLYNPHRNSLVLRFLMEKLDVKRSTDDKHLIKTHQDIHIKNIPHQKWLQVAILINNRVVDVYINKLLHQTILLDNVPILSNEGMVLGRTGQNANVYLGRVEYANQLLKVNDIKALHFRNMRGLSVPGKMRAQVNNETHEYISSLYGPSESSE